MRERRNARSLLHSFSSLTRSLLLLDKLGWMWKILSELFPPNLFLISSVIREKTGLSKRGRVLETDGGPPIGVDRKLLKPPNLQMKEFSLREKASPAMLSSLKWRDMNSCAPFFFFSPKQPRTSGDAIDEAR